jgi:hypothetical protein
MGVGEEMALMNIEQLKLKIADAIEHRTDPPVPKKKAKYHLWVDTFTHQIGCSWAPGLRLQNYQKVVYTFMRDVNAGFTSDEWEEMAQKFAPFFPEYE